MAITPLANGMRNPMHPSGGTFNGVTYVGYGGRTAVGDGVADDTGAILDALYLSRGTQGAQQNWNWCGVYLPALSNGSAATYLVSQIIVIRRPITIIGEPSAPPTIKLKANSAYYASGANGGSNPFVVTDSGYNHAVTDTTSYQKRSGVTFSATNNDFFVDIRDVNFTVSSGNPSCTWAFVWALAQQVALRNCIITADSATNTCLLVGESPNCQNDNGSTSPTPNRSGGGGGTVTNVTCIGGQNSLGFPSGAGSYFPFRGCTFNGPVSVDNCGYANFVACTFNTGPFHASQRVFLDDCVFQNGATLLTSNLTNDYHIENSGGIIQATGGPTGGGQVFYNGSLTPGTSGSLSVAGVIKGTPYANPAYPYAPATTIVLTSNGGDNTTQINNNLLSGGSVYLNPVNGGFTCNTTINMGPGSRLYGASMNVSTLALNGNPGIAVSGTGVVIANVGGGSNSGTTVQWNADTTSQFLDSQIVCNGGGGTSLVIQSGGGVFENHWLVSPVSAVGAIMTTTQPTYLYSFAPEHYTLVPMQLNNCQQLYGRAVQFEIGPSSPGSFCSINGGSNINISGIISSGGVTQEIICTNSPGVAIWGTWFYNFNGGNPSQVLLYNGTPYGPFSASFLEGFIIPSTAVNGPPSVSASSATNVGLQTATLNGSITSTNGNPITSDGFKWGPASSPQTYPNVITETTPVQSGSFSSQLTGLTTGTTYFYEATAVNSNGPSVSTPVSFTPNPPPPLVQKKTTTQSASVSLLALQFNNPQASGNRNIVAICFNIGPTITSVTDTQLNTYTQVSPLTSGATGDAQSIWTCSPTLADGATPNTVTVHLSAATTFVGLRITEYHGLGGLDVNSEASGTGTLAALTGAVTTRNTADVLVVAVVASSGVTGVDAASSFTEQLNGVSFGNDLQDLYASSLVTPTAKTDLGGSGTWVVNMVAFAPSGSLTIPAVSVSAATSIGTTTATLNGAITSAGGQSITADGFDWGTTTTYGTHVNVTPAVQSGSFLANLTVLSPGTTYHYRSTAINASGTGTSGDQQFSTASVGAVYSLITNGHAYVNPSSVTGSSITLTPAWAQSVGDILIVAIGYTSGSATVTVSDTANGAYSIAVGPTVDTPGGQTQYVFYRSNIASANSGTNTITCSFSASTLPFPDMRVSEFSSTLGTTWTVNQKVGLAASSATTDTSGNMSATTVSNALIYGAGYTSNAISAAGPGFTAIDITAIDSNLHEYQVVTSVGSYAATGSDGAGGTVIMQAVAFVTTPGATAIPALIQHASSASNSQTGDNFGTGVGGSTTLGNSSAVYHWTYPNPSLSGNSLILEASGRVTGNPSITDNTGNIWTFQKSISDGTTQTSVFTCIGAITGTQRLVITFPSACYNAHFSGSEFNNISSVVGSSSLHSSGTSTISSGALTGGIQGDLVWSCGFDTQNSAGLSTNLNGIAAGSGMQLLSADSFVGHFAQYVLQPSATNLTPTSTLTGSTDAFNAVAVVLRAGFQGSSLPTGIRVMRVQGVTATRAINVQFPSSGNLIYSVTGFNSSLTNLTAPSGWTQVANNGGGISSYVTGINSPTLSVAFTGATTGSTTLCTIFLYDIIGAAASPFDLTTNAGNIGFTGPQTNFVAGTITPTTANGLCIFSVPINAGVVVQPSASPQCMCDMTWYVGETGADLMSNADGYGHIYNGSSSIGVAQPFTWGILDNAGQVDSVNYMAVAFKAGNSDITAPSAPTGFSASTVSTSSVSINWTVPVSLVDQDNTNIQITYPVEHMGGEFLSFTQFGIGPGVVSGADSLLDSGLLHPGTQYSYQMRARDPAGNNSGYTTTFFGTTSAADVTKPTVPGIPTLVSETNNSITIAWATSTDIQEPSVSLTYTLQRSTNGGLFTQIATNIPGVASGNITYSDAGLTALNQYAYQVQAVNPANLSGSNSSNFSTASATITTEPNPPFFVQGNTSSASGVTSATCSFNSAQTTGDGNLVVISTSSAAAINISGPVTDQAGNTYALIGGPTSAGSNPVLTQWIYFSNI